MRDAELRQRLPGLNKPHLRLDETHLSDVLVGFQDACRDLRAARHTGFRRGGSLAASREWVTTQEAFGSRRGYEQRRRSIISTLRAHFSYDCSKPATTADKCGAAFASYLQTYKSKYRSELSGGKGRLRLV